MACRSIYYFDNSEDYDAACSALSYHLSTSDYKSVGFDHSNYGVFIYDDCEDVVKAASICREHGGKYSDPN